jgi:hypothetical protein
MANARRFGGGYVEGAGAQEENMFRRTDCHFADDGVDFSTGQYDAKTSALINGADGRVYLDVTTPRVCVRGPEDMRDKRNLGYKWLAQDEIFPFLEIRAAAVDLSKGGTFDPRECRRRIDAQLDTLISSNVRYAVLSAIGCGAFKNPAAVVARCYKESLTDPRRRGAFECVVFAIFNPGYGPNDNLAHFMAAFQTASTSAAPEISSSFHNGKRM